MTNKDLLNNDEFGHGQQNNFPFVDSFKNIEDMSQDIFKQMDDMFVQMFTSSFNHFDSIEFEENNANESDPRSLMLKDPDCKESEQHHVGDSFEVMKSNRLEDNDIDDEVSKHGLMLNKWVPTNTIPQTFSYKKFSVRTIRLPDGTLEEHRNITDGQGNVTTTVRRSIGNQSYEVTTHSDGHGMKETQENLTNYDENELSSFEKRWQDLKGTIAQLPSQDRNSESLVPKLTVPPGDPSYLSLFKKFFGF